MQVRLVDERVKVLAAQMVLSILEKIYQVYVSSRQEYN